MRLKLLATLVLSMSWVPTAGANPPVPDVPYGTKPYQLFDWYPAAAEPGLPAGPRPWVLFAHGTGTDKSGIGIQSFKVMLDLMVRNGVTVFAANWGNYPEVYPTQLHDLTLAIQFIKHNAATYDVDPTRFAMWGSSAGATISGWLSYGEDQANPIGSPQQQESTRPLAFMNWGGLSNFLLMDPTMSALGFSAPTLADLSLPFKQSISFSELVTNNATRSWTPVAQSYYGSVQGSSPYTNPHDVGLMYDFHAKLDQSYPAEAAQSMMLTNPAHPHVNITQVETLADWSRGVFGFETPLNLGYSTAGSVKVPKLWGDGPAVAGSSFTLTLRAGVSHQTLVMFVAGYKRVDLKIPALDAHLVPAPTIFAVYATDPTGRLDMGIKVDPTIIPGTSLYVQAVHPDVGASKGLAVSNAVKITTK